MGIIIMQKYKITNYKYIYIYIFSLISNHGCLNMRAASNGH